MHKNNKIQIKNFSSIKLSIIIVIIGFLIARISADSSMIKQTQLRSVFYIYASVYNNFVAKYNAYIFWGSNCSIIIPDICNGDVRVCA